MALHQKSRTKTYIDWLLVVAIIVGVGLWFMFSQEHKKVAKVPQKETVTELNVTRLKSQDVKITQTYIGYVEPIHEVEIVPYIAGFLDKIQVTGGDKVTQGQPLITIQPDEYQARFDSAKATVLQAQANLNNAKIYYQRMHRAGTKVISKTELDNAKAKYLSAKAEVAQAKAQRDLAQVNLDYTKITAPIPGLVGNVSLTRGDYVSPNSGVLLKIIQFDPIRVVFSITDKDYLDEILAHDKHLFSQEDLKIRLGNGEVYAHAGKFRFWDNELNKKTNSIAVYADFPNAQNILVANAYVDVLLERNLKNVVLIPQNKVTMSEKGSFVYLFKNKKLYKRFIKILARQDGNYIVKNNFSSGDYLVLSRVQPQNLTAKIKINLLETSSVEEKE